MDATGFRVWLPFPPTANNIFSQGVVKGKIRRFPSRQYKEWRFAAGLLLNRERAKQLGDYFKTPVVVTIALKSGGGRRRDADNYIKPVLDALKEARIVHDDSDRWVWAVSAYWNRDYAATAGAYVSIRPVRAPVEVQENLPGLTAA